MGEVGKEMIGEPWGVQLPVGAGTGTTEVLGPSGFDNSIFQKSAHVINTNEYI